MQKYSYRLAWNPEDEAYVATSGEFPGLSGLGGSVEQALSELQVAIEGAEEALVEDGKALPKPQVAGEYSGQVRLRMPKRLHSALAEMAESEGVSLNTLLVQILSEGLGGQLATRSVCTALSYATWMGGVGLASPAAVGFVPAAIHRSSGQLQKVRQLYAIPPAFPLVLSGDDAPAANLPSPHPVAMRSSLSDMTQPLETLQ